MLPKMSEEKTISEPTNMIGQNEVSPPLVPSRARPCRKYVIIAVTGVVVAAVILTAILVGMHLFTEGQKDILKFSNTRDENTKENTKEEVINYPDTNIVQFRVLYPDYEMWIINDFNRDIQTMKIKTEYSTYCYLAPLNRTTASDPTKINAPSDIKKQDGSHGSRTSVTPIPDISFLSKAVTDTCQGISTYWVYPSCEVPNTTHSTEIRRRGAPGSGSGAPSAPSGPSGQSGSSGPSGQSGSSGPPAGPGPFGSSLSDGVCAVFSCKSLTVCDCIRFELSEPSRSSGLSGSSGPTGPFGLPGPTGAFGLPGPSGSSGSSGPSG